MYPIKIYWIQRWDTVQLGFGKVVHASCYIFTWQVVYAILMNISLINGVKHIMARIRRKDTNIRKLLVRPPHWIIRVGEEVSMSWSRFHSHNIVKRLLAHCTGKAPWSTESWRTLDLNMNQWCRPMHLNISWDTKLDKPSIRHTRFWILKI